MLHLQATKKALQRLGLGSEIPAEAEESMSALGNWFVNIVPLGSREGFLFMSTRSLLSFPILIGQKIPEPADMLLFLEHGIKTLVKEMGTPDAESSLLIEDVQTVTLCSSSDKSILGVHKAIAADYFQHIQNAGGIKNSDLGVVIRNVNTTPRAKLDWSTSFEVSAQLLAASVA